MYFDPVEEQYRVERIGPGSYQHLVTLVRRCFGTHISLAYVQAKYNTASFGASDIGFIAFAHNGEPAAYYGVFPVLVRLQEGVHLAAQSGDTMTDPDHQKKGLFIRLAKLTYELAAANGVRFIFGFPNENSKPGFERKLDWVFTGHLHDFRLNTDALPLCELASKFRWLAPLYAALVRKRSARLVSVRPAFQWELHTAGPVRDERFDAYKRALGGMWIEVSGIRMLVKPEVHLYVGDVACERTVDAELLKHALVQAAKQLFCRQVVCTLSLGHPHFDLLSGMVAPKRSLPIGHLDLGSRLPIADLSFSRADLDTF